MRFSRLFIGLVLGVLLWSADASASFTGELSVGMSDAQSKTSVYLSGEQIRPMGFIGYEKTSYSGFLTQDLTLSEIGGWLGITKQVVTGNVSLRYGAMWGNQLDQTKDLFLDTIDPFVALTTDYKTSAGPVAFGGSTIGRIHYGESYSPSFRLESFVELRNNGRWQAFVGFGSEPAAAGIKYVSDSDLVSVGIQRSGGLWEFNGSLEPDEFPLSAGFGWSEENWKAFVRYSF